MSTVYTSKDGMKKLVIVQDPDPVNPRREYKALLDEVPDETSD